MSNNNLRETVWEALSESTPNNLMNFTTALASNELAAEDAIEQFSPFDEEHIEKARDIWETFFSLADNFQKDDKSAVEDAVNEYLNLKNTKNPEMLDYALMVFLTHNERARRVLNGSIPSILRREPEKIAPSSGMFFRVEKKTEENETEVQVEYSGGTTSQEENKLNWYREDPLFNEHHEHWHVIYPNRGIKNRVIDRQGEIFIYMHQQMIARYDTERIAIGLKKLEPYFDFNKPIEIGYDTGEFITLFGDIRYSSRGPNSHILPFRGYTPLQHSTFQRRLKDAVSKGFVEVDNKKIKITPDLVGLLVESIGRDVEKFRETKFLYGNIHNMGHMLIANCLGDDKPWGIMSAPAINIRDTVFWQWHKHIDDYKFWWQETQKSNDLSDAPNVIIRKGFDWSPDIILCDFENLSLASKYSMKSFEQIGVEQFGGNNWNRDFTDSQLQLPISETESRKLTTSTLQTQLNEGRIEIRDPNSTNLLYKIPYKYLNHQRFSYFIRLQNLSPVSTKVTLRTFLVPKEEAENRRMWIEMDKFTYELEADSKHVVFRKDTDSSVIKKPAVIDPSFENADYKPLSVDWRGIFSYNIDEFIQELSNLVNLDPDTNNDGQPDDDPVNSPDLLNYKQIFDQAQTDFDNHVIDEFTYKKEKASFRSFLNKYLSNISIAWGEFKKIDFSAFGVLRQQVDNEYILVNANQTSEDINLFYNSLKKFIQLFHDLLEAAVKSMKEELSRTLAVVYEKVYNTSYCECGLPYNLLLPRGTKEGMEFYLMVMVTDWKKDILGEEDCCGSMSYCGAKGKYPDIREMGYPFDRPFENGILDTISAQPNMACRTIKIISDGVE